jgi:chromosome partitioning protein
MASDLVLVPVQPSPYDVWAAKEIIDLLNEAAVYKPTLLKAFTINRKIVNTAIGRDVADALSEYPIPVLQTAISQRVAFAESATQGLTVYELDADMPAALEMDQLAEEIRALLK